MIEGLELLEDIEKGDVMPHRTQDALTYVKRGVYTLEKVRTAITSGVAKMYEASTNCGYRKIAGSFKDILEDLQNGRPTTLYGVEIPALI